jgi:ferrous iron transport protein B
MSMALLFRRTILKGEAAPLMIELPDYKVPSLRTALLTAFDRGKVFVRKAGTIILAISIVLWWLMSFPALGADDIPASAASAIATAEAQAAVHLAQGDLDAAAGEHEMIDHLMSQASLEHSLAGRFGKLIEPVFAPLGFDWRISVGVVVSFAAREVFVAAMGVIYGVGEESGDALLERLRNATHADGSAVFSMATSASILVFFVLAMQCLATLAVTRRETNSWGWALFQWAYMFLLAYVGAFLTRYAVLWTMGG